MMNSVNMIGRLTRDPETRTTTGGTKVAEFSIAVDNPFDKEQTNFFRCKAWGKTAEFVENYLSKGRLVSVSGRLEQRKYQDKEGNNREAFEIVAERVNGLDRPKDDAPKQTTAAKQEVDEYDPFADE